MFISLCCQTGTCVSTECRVPYYFMKSRNVKDTLCVWLQVEALVDSIECHMLVDLQNRVTRDMTQVQTEMIRNDGTLPTEVWKKLVRAPAADL